MQSINNFSRRAHQHKDYCCTESPPTLAIIAQQSPFDKHGFCVDCGITETGTAPLYTSTELRIQGELKSLMNNLRNRSFSATRNSDFLKGTFQRLLDPVTFASEMFPGVPNKIRQDLPKNVNELLQWHSISVQMTDLIPKITKAAAEILANVQSKGLSRGDSMNPEEEFVIIPQIAQGMSYEHNTNNKFSNFDYISISQSLSREN